MVWSGRPLEIHTANSIATIRAANSQDTVKLFSLRKKALLDHPTAFGANGLQSEAKYLEWVEGLISADRQYTLPLVVSEVEDLIGMGVIRRGTSPKQAHSAEINAIYLLPEWRGYGLVQALLDTMEAWARSMGVVVIKLQVTTVNFAAIRAYEKAGYKIYATDPMVLYVNKAYLDEYLMVKVLD